MTPEVEGTIEEIRQAFPGHRVEAEPEEQGGAYVVVHDLPISNQYVPSVSWVGFLIGFQYPYADVYPHFIDGNVRRRDDASLGEAFSGPTQWRGRNAFQISRRSNRLNPDYSPCA